MTKVKLVFISVLSIFLIILVWLYVIGYFEPKKAGILVESEPQARVFINGREMGVTPYQNSFEAGTIVLELLPVDEGKNFLPFDTKVSLAPGIQTVVKRVLGAAKEASGGIVVSFEKIPGNKDAEMALVSDPDITQVLIDGIVKGFSPFKSDSISPRDHIVTVSAPGYSEASYPLKLVKGYKLIAIVKLIQKEAPPPEEKKEEVKVPRVKILDTSTGFLRVRESASTTSKEVARVTPGKIYKLLEKNEDNTWYRIEYEKEISEGETTGMSSNKKDSTASGGWISAEFAEIVEDL